MITRQMRQLILPLGIALTIGSFLGAALIFLTPVPATAQGSDWPEINLVEITAGLEKPTHITHAGDGSDRLFVVEQAGRIRIIKDGVLQTAPFLSITGRVRDDGDEQGLLSLAFPPGYAGKGYFYVNYTREPDGATVVARYDVSDNDPDIADPAGEEVILSVAQPFQNHNGGQLAFGPNDGYLYIGLGDGGSGGDPQNHAQRTNSLLGKILRIDVESGETPYAIPADNPFTQTEALDEIWALGLRNPWRFSFDRQTGDLYIGDVGQNAYEEVNFQPASSAGGENYGWRCKEGFHDFNTSQCPAGLTLEPPIEEYEHSIPNAENNHSVTGGFVYRGPAQRLQGLYFYADYRSGRIWGMRREGAAWQSQELTRTTYLITTFGEDEAGNLYLAARGGEIYRITEFLPDLTASTKDVAPATGDPGQTFTYTITLINSGPPLTQTTYLTDTLPAGLAYIPGSLEATFGMVNDAGPELLWQGLMNPTSTVQITYQVTATGLVTGALQNIAVVKTQNFGPYTLAKTILLGVVREHYLPVIFKQPSS